MLRQCVTCGIESNNKKDYFELSAKVGPRYICRECAAELGIKNFMSAGFNSNTGVLKKYVKIHPEAQPRLEAQLERVAKYNADFKKELGNVKSNIKQNFKEGMEEASRHSGCKKQKQTKCVCASCNHVFYYGNFDTLKNLQNAAYGSIYSLNKYKDLGQCPKCGSRAISKKEVYFWVDKKGNCVDVEE